VNDESNLKLKNTLANQKRLYEEMKSENQLYKKKLLSQRKLFENHNEKCQYLIN
jgi:hypothetical protein